MRRSATRVLGALFLNSNWLLQGTHNMWFGCLSFELSKVCGISNREQEILTLWLLVQLC